MSNWGSESRRQKKAMNRVREIQRGARNEDTRWEDVQNKSRHERRRFAKAKRKYDKIHGEGEADRVLREAIERDGADGLSEHFLEGGALGRGDR